MMILGDGAANAHVSSRVSVPHRFAISHAFRSRSRWRCSAPSRYLRLQMLDKGFHRSPAEALETSVAVHAKSVCTAVKNVCVPVSRVHNLLTS
jgi:hypothetical protein